MPGTGDTDRETYTHGHHQVVVDEHARRTAERNAAYLLPHLWSGMSLIDVGCGPGSITAGLARAVAPGRVVGVDMSEAAIGRARGDALAAGVSNLEYDTADAYALPFDDGSFDAAHMHQVLQHLADPAGALQEAVRLLSPRGVVGVTEVDWGTAAFWPCTPLLDRFLEVYRSVARHNGGDPAMGRRLRSLFNEAGLARVEVRASVWSFADAGATRSWGGLWSDRLLQSSIGRTAVDAGLASRSELEEIAAALRSWGEAPDAFFAFTHGEALGWTAAG